MRRAAFTLIATVVGLVALLGFKSHGSGVTNRPAALAPVTPGAAPSSPSASGPPSPSPHKHRRHTSTASATRTLTGASIVTQYGPVQVRVTLAGTRITDITALQLPDSQGRDIQIDNAAVPLLRQEALAAQSARINVVSGATYTSDGYAQSLQSALDKA